MTTDTPAPAEAPATGTLDWYKNRCWVLDHVLAGDEASLPPDVLHLHRKDGLILKVLNLLDRAEAAEAERDRLREAVANVEELARNWREQAWANDAAGAPRSAADKAISPTLKVCAYRLNKALIPAQKASHD